MKEYKDMSRSAAEQFKNKYGSSSDWVINNDSLPPLSVIVPFRDEGVAAWFLPRLEELCQDFPKDSGIEFIVVDSGSIPESQIKCRDICERTGVRYIYHDTRGQTFSIGAARDHGVINANGRAVTFYDIDFRAPEDFWIRLISFMRTFGVSAYRKRFFTVPALYLTEAGTQEFLENNTNTRWTEFLLRWMYGNTESVINLAPCSSIAIIDRFHYLAVGGHDPIFQGHGYEDFELYHRLIEHEGRLPKPDVYLKDTKSWDTATYNGFRSRLSLLGRPALLNNLFVVHLWHSRPRSLTFYNAKSTKQVRKIWPEIFDKFDKTRNHPSPLCAREAFGNKFIVMGTPNSNLTRCLREALPLLGEPVYLSEADFIDTEGNFLSTEFFETVSGFGAGLILFNAPYGRESRRQIYDWCRRVDFPYLVFERGALPESWFFDQNGFNADSRSYDPVHWDKPLTSGQLETVNTYIEQAVRGHSALEAQSDRIGKKAIAAKLGIGGKRVLFVPLQRPSDTVIKFMSGPIGSHDNFLHIIDEAASILKRHGWVVLCKRHPLETESPELTHAKYVPHDTNFLDLIDMSDAVALINSGVGLYAMMMEKPCYIFGNAFYYIDGVNRRITTPNVQALVSEILTGYSVDMTRVHKFMSYLIERFYSFGTPRTHLRKELDGSWRSITTEIDFYKLRLPHVGELSYEREERGQLSKSAPIFERFRLDLVQKRKSSASPRDTGSIIRPTNQAGRSRDKLRKLWRNPHAFFRDSRVPLFRHLSVLFRA